MAWAIDAVAFKLDEGKDLRERLDSKELWKSVEKSEARCFEGARKVHPPASEK
jgi:hypothetical protein